MATNDEKLKALDLENRGGEQEQEALKRAAHTDRVVRGVDGSVVPRARKLRPLAGIIVIALDASHDLIGLCGLLQGLLVLLWPLVLQIERVQLPIVSRHHLAPFPGSAGIGCGSGDRDPSLFLPNSHNENCFVEQPIHDVARSIYSEVHQLRFAVHQHQ